MRCTITRTFRARYTHRSPVSCRSNNSRRSSRIRPVCMANQFSTTTSNSPPTSSRTGHNTMRAARRPDRAVRNTATSPSTRSSSACPSRLLTSPRRAYAEVRKFRLRSNEQAEPPPPLGARTRSHRKTRRSHSALSPRVAWQSKRRPRSSREAKIRARRRLSRRIRRRLLRTHSPRCRKRRLVRHRLRLRKPRRRRQRVQLVRAAPLLLLLPLSRPRLRHWASSTTSCRCRSVAGPSTTPRHPVPTPTRTISTNS